MNTFIPYPDIEKVAGCLDSQRLVKQSVETGQILNTLQGGAGWANHPAVKMWRHNTNFLVNYGLAICAQCKARGYKWEGMYDKIIAFYDESRNDEAPDWWGGPIHDTHKSKLLLKGCFDVLCHGIKRYFGLKNVNNWLKTYVGKEKHELCYDDLGIVRKFLDKAPDYGKVNHYEKFGWGVGMNREYIWPI